MWLAARCHDLGEVDIRELTTALNRQPQALWDADEALKQKLAGNRQTQSLFLQVITTEEFVDIIQHRKITQDDVPHYMASEYLQAEVQPILDYALSHFPKDGVVLRVQMARMLPGAKIPSHVDACPLLTSCHRLHVPLQTNENIHFTVDNERIVMQAGRLYNLNNRVPHWVENKSDEARIHLIIDYLPPENNTSAVLKPDFDLVLKKRHAQQSLEKALLPRKNITLPKVIATSVIRGAHQNESHGGVYLIDLNNETYKQVVDWDNCNIDFSGRGWDRGLRGICFYNEHIYIASSDELFCFDQDFTIVDSYKNPYLKHAHEIVVDGDSLYITSTGFDSVLRFNLSTNVFEHAWLIRISSSGSMELNQYEPVEPFGPEPGNTTHINNVFCDSEGLYVSGRNAPYLFHFYQDKAKMLCKLPLGTHNAKKYNNGIIFNDTESDQVVYMSNYDYVVATVPNYHVDDLTHTELGDKNLARQAFGRGLCTLEENIAIGGSSPSTISVYDMNNGAIIKTVNISMDIRNAIHGLEIWPFDS
ncbi:aspartyl/asparaginyl beta-hydroxylase domain-containing protein [Colwelliaceae bacterium 6471]